MAGKSLRWMKRKDIIKWHLTSDGTIRFYRDDEKKSGVSEMVLAPPVWDHRGIELRKREQSNHHRQ